MSKRNLLMAMGGVGFLAVAAAAPVAVTAPVAGLATVTGVSSAEPVVDLASSATNIAAVSALSRPRRGRGHHGPPPCAYPPARAPQVDLSGPGRTRRGHVALSGRVRVHHCGYKGYKVGLYVSYDGRRHWKKLFDTVSGDDGYHGFDVDLTKTAYFRSVATGTDGYYPALSERVKVSVVSWGRRSGRH